MALSLSLLAVTTSLSLPLGCMRGLEYWSRVTACSPGFGEKGLVYCPLIPRSKDSIPSELLLDCLIGVRCCDLSPGSPFIPCADLGARSAVAPAMPMVKASVCKISEISVRSPQLVPDDSRLFLASRDRWPLWKPWGGSYAATATTTSYLFLRLN